jgi:outer membrane protein OmpA-like peptidoglycan-associated protein
MVNIPNLIGDMFFDKKYDEVLKAFDQLSGAFYPSIIRSGAQNIGMDSLYARMKPKEKAESRIWGEYYFAGNYYGDFGNLNGDFNNDLQGARVGWDIRADDSNVLGIYARFGQNKYKQGPDKADGTDIEIGLYSGLLSETKLDFKWNVSLGMQSYDVKREIGFVDEDTYDGLYPQSSFNTYSLRFGIESAYNMPISKGIIKPFIGLRGGMVLSPKITETNGDEANLIIDEKNYLRAETLFGVAWKNKTDKWSPYVKVFGSYLLTGETPKSDISFQGAPEAGEMDIWGAKEGPMLAGISAGIEYDFNSDVSAYSNLTGQIGFGDNEYYGYYANIGISVRIGGEPQPKSETPKTQSPEAAIASEHIVITIPAEPPIEAAAVAVNSVSEAKERRKNAVASFKLEAATFQNGSSKLSAAAKSKIRNMANKIKAIEYNKITVEGHTDSFGKYQNNMPLSVNRAKAVMQELVNNGIPRKKLQFIGFASDIPIQSNKTPKGRQANRRVEIFVE